MDHAPKDRKPASVDIADFVARWPEIVEALGSGATAGVDVVKDGQVVAVVRPPAASLHGYLRGSVRLPDGLDLTKPVFEDEVNAERGRIHE